MPSPPSSDSSLTEHPLPVLLFVLAWAVFAQATSEFALAGLLPQLAGDLDVSVANQLQGLLRCHPH